MKMVSTFSERIKYAMQLRNVRAIDICRACNITKPQMSHYIKGTYKPKAESIMKIARFLMVDDVWLIGYGVDMNRYSNTLDGAKREIMDMLDQCTNADLDIIKKFIKDYFIDRK